MQHLHEAEGPFGFCDAADRGIITCQRVADGAPVLHVSHDEDGDWQFLCGGDHSDGGDEAVLSCLRCLVARDATLKELGELCRNQEASRPAAGKSWAIRDRSEAFIRHWVAKLGWANQLVEEGASDTEPPFAYTVGLTQRFDHPELIVVGLKPDSMQFVLNQCADRVKNGTRLKAGARLDEVIDGFQVEVRTLDPSLLHFLGYARWFHGDRPFEALQILWPDREGRFPGDPAMDGWAAARQQLR